MNEKKKHSHSLFIKIIVPLIIVMMLQSVIFFCVTFFGGVSDTINQNAEDILTERVINQEKTLETLFTTQWTNFTQPTNSIRQVYQNVSDDSDMPVYSSTELQKEVLSKVSDTLINMLRTNEVTGVFLILNNEKGYVPRKSGETQEKYGVCIRDYSPTSEYTENEDLLVMRCPSSMMSSIGCSMETWWNALYTFNDTTPGDYYYMPLQLAYENPDADNLDLAYFDGVHNMGQADRTVVSYSIPLVDDTGYPYAVLGIELTVDYLKSLIPASTLYSSNSGCYALVQYLEGSNEYEVIASSGVMFQQCFGSVTSFVANDTERGILTCETTNGNNILCGSISNLQIYNHNTPYEDQKLALIGLVKEDSLYSINGIVRNSIIFGSVVVIILGCISVLFISRQLTKPINKLSQKVRETNSGTSLQLERLNIDEIDDLVKSIEDLSDKVNRTAIRTEFFSRMSHDMRTPMNAIIGFSSPELLENADMKLMREYMDKIHSSGDFLLTLINEVLDMSKIEMQRMELREEPINQKMLLNAVSPIIEEVAAKRNVNFEIHADGSQTAFYGDIQRLSQVLINLLSNAVKFTPAEGTVSLQIQEIFIAEDSVTNRIVVHDTGSGMSEEF